MISKAVPLLPSPSLPLWTWTDECLQCKLFYLNLNRNNNILNSNMNLLLERIQLEDNTVISNRWWNRWKRGWLRRIGLEGYLYQVRKWLKVIIRVGNRRYLIKTISSLFSRFSQLLYNYLVLIILIIHLGWTRIEDKGPMREECWVSISHLLIRVVLINLVAMKVRSSTWVILWELSRLHLLITMLGISTLEISIGILTLGILIIS